MEEFDLDMHDYSGQCKRAHGLAQVQLCVEEPYVMSSVRHAN